MPSVSVPETAGTVLSSHFLVILPEIWPRSKGKAGLGGGNSLIVSMSSGVLAEAGFESQHCHFLAPRPWKLLSLSELYFPHG